jgi:hypothetical protein
MTPICLIPSKAFVTSAYLSRPPCYKTTVMLDTFHGKGYKIVHTRRMSSWVSSGASENLKVSFLKIFVSNIMGAMFFLSTGRKFAPLIVFGVNSPLGASPLKAATHVTSDKKNSDLETTEVCIARPI